MGIGGSELSVLTQFLSIRSQHVQVDGCRCKLVNFVSGVAQFGVLGPLLFLLFNSEMFSILDIRACCTFFHTHASLLCVFVCLIVLFHSCCPMRECLGKHSCMSSPFPIAILNGTSSFLSLVQENIKHAQRTLL